ncbi:MAG: zf-HC2 domain-containing protein [Acidobacteria bacterium]|nr:zf-HC2 domain-containing protein [Acidobacteriota bacterium]
MNVCTQNPDTLALYALSALAEDERRAFERHLTGCTACRKRLHSKAALRSVMLAYIRPRIASVCPAGSHWSFRHGRRTLTAGTGLSQPHPRRRQRCRPPCSRA